MIFAYARVSTKDQNLSLQEDALKQYGYDEIYKERKSGMDTERPQLTSLVEKLRKGDILLVWKLDRLGRSTRHVLEIAEQLEEKGVELVSLQDKIDTTTAMGKAMFRMMTVLNEMERDIISERTKAGLESARSRGRVGGRPKKNSKDVHKALKLYDSKEYTICEIVEMTNVSKATLYRKIKERESSQ
ncbi:recombinase family protein [Jeotgalibacillus haloalkalitolerans]|uniref:Recombinase family protein n=1 Tax=Jeotgalibacillus haloalkalitolerans TaxID=3104292 RepID=A0ABU5KNQ5_9BACL|nr:recombinase family protein [Jeotgalibacillus sp. HH7-29]MDZ5712784.1 recombinase family protein [Jeotgalibacillus sp. HH7-29]